MCSIRSATPFILKCKAHMRLLKIHLCKHSFGSFLALLDEHNLQFTVGERSSSEKIASRCIDILLTRDLWCRLPSVIMQFLCPNNRKVFITTTYGQRISAAGFTHTELERLVAQAKDIEVIATELEQPQLLHQKHAA
jgi:hypothetical protein